MVRRPSFEKNRIKTEPIKKRKNDLDMSVIMDLRASIRIPRHIRGPIRRIAGKVLDARKNNAPVSLFNTFSVHRYFYPFLQILSIIWTNPSMELRLKRIRGFIF